MLHWLATYSDVLQLQALRSSAEAITSVYTTPLKALQKAAFYASCKCRHQNYFNCYVCRKKTPSKSISTHIFLLLLFGSLKYMLMFIEILQQENSHNCPNTNGNQCGHTTHFYIQCLLIYTLYY